MNICDVCGVSNETVKAGRWIFYCPAHKQNDWEKTYNNEIANRDDWSNIDGELAEMLEINS